jgi:hypothetical protein
MDEKFCETDYKKLLLNYLSRHGIENKDTNKIIKELLALIPDSLKESEMDEYELIFKYAPIFFD